MASSLLRAISDELDRGDVKNAQQLMATADPTAVDADGLSYLTTRLLFVQKRLSPEQAAERLLDLTTRLPDFQEAVQMLRQIAPHLAPASSAARPPSHPAEAPRRSPLPPADAPRRSPLPPAETPRRSPLPPAVRPGAAAVAAAAVAARAKMKAPAAKSQPEKAVQTPAAPAAAQRAPSMPPPAAKPEFDDFDDFDDPFASPAADPPPGASAPMMRHSQPAPARPGSIPPAAQRTPSGSPARFPSMPPLADSGRPAPGAPVRSPAVDPQLSRSPSMPPPGRSPSMPPPGGRSPSMPPPGGRSPSMPPPGGRAPSVPAGPRTPSMAPSPIVSPLHQPSVRPAGESIAPPPPSNRGAALYASVSPAKRYSGNAPAAGSLSSDEGDADFVIPRDPPAQRAPSIIPAFRNRTPLPWSTDPPPSAGAPAPRIPAFPGIPSVGIPGTSAAQPKGPAALGHSDRPPAIMSPPPSIREARPKSLLPPGAGKYSAKPPETESIRPRNSPVPAVAPPGPPKRSSPRPPPVSERDPRSGRRSSPKPPPVVEQDARLNRRSSPRPPPVVEQDARLNRRSSPRPPPVVEHEPPLRRSSPRPPPLVEQTAPLRRSSPRPPPMDAPPPSMRTLDEADALVLSGKHEMALAALTSSAATQLQPFTQSDDFNPAVLGTVAASFLNVGPVTREFAPYDLSLHSLARLEAALEVLFGADPLPAPDAKNPLLLLLGQYVGETLRQCQQGNWEGGISDPLRARVLVGHRSWQPFQLIVDRWQFGGGSPIRAGIQSAMSQRDSTVWHHRIACPLEPPMPWSGNDWPSVSLMPDLSAYVAEGIIARYCEMALHQSLDGSMTSIGALDGFVGLIAPPGVAADPNEGWVKRIAVLLGAYLGEVFCRASAGTGWISLDQAEGPDDYVIVLRNGSHAKPVAEILSRFGRVAKVRLSDYLRDVMLASRPPV